MESLRDQILANRSGLYGFALKRTGFDVDRANDLVQEVIQRALQFEHTFKHCENPHGWLCRILVNIQHSEYRRNRVVYLDTIEHLAVDPIPPNQIDRIEFQEIMERINRLPKNMQEILREVFINGKKYEEIAEQLGIEV